MSMKRVDRDSSGPSARPIPGAVPGNNGKDHVAEISAPELSLLLSSLQTMRDGDFSVRLPGTWTGLPGKLADTFNEIVSSNQQIAHELRRVGQVVGKEGKTRERTQFHQPRGAWGECSRSARQPDANCSAGRRWPAARGGVSTFRHHR
jgi:hypothetical protein